jgi:hypothetical protein
MNPHSQISPVRHAFINERGALGFGVVGGLLLFLAVSGLGIWLLPFSLALQIVVLSHTVIGFVAIPFVGVWQLSHWLGSRKAPRTFRKICAYVGFWLLAINAVAGIVVSAQAAFTRLVSPAWHFLHLWTGVTMIPVFAIHVLPSGQPSTDHNDCRSERRRTWKLATILSAVLSIASIGIAMAYSRAQRANGAAQSMLTSENQPFAPSNVDTESGMPLPVPLLANSESCGTSDCHSAIYKEWGTSAHRWSAEDEFFQEVRRVTTEVKGRHETEKCAACHDPVSLLAGQKSPYLGRSAAGYKEGESCVVCHAVSRMDQRGIGSYVLRTPKPYLYDNEASGYQVIINHFLIRSYPHQHDRDYDLAGAKTPESCAPCHKEFDVLDPKEGPVEVETQFDDWKQGKWNTDADPGRRLYCQQCHMYLLETSRAEADPYDLKVGLGAKHRNHAFPAANQFMPLALSAPDAIDHTQRVEEWLRGERVVTEIEGTWPKGPIVQLEIVAPPVLKPGKLAKFQVVLKNEKVGHGFPTGPLNISRAWIEVNVRDADGKTVFHSGMLDFEGHIEAGSYILKPLAFDTSGRMILKPDLWHPNGPKFRPAILAGQSQSFEYEFLVPPKSKGRLSVDARLRYRKANQFFMDAVYTDQRRQAPITDVSSGHLVIAASR